MSIQRHTAYNLLGSVIPLVTSLLTVPAYLEAVGEARFGVLALSWLLLGYFGLFDLGLGRATAQRVAALRSDESILRTRVFWTAMHTNIGLGVLGGLLVWPAGIYVFSGMMDIDETVRVEIIRALPWLIAAVPLATLSGVMAGALQGRERFLELNIVSVIGTTLFQVVPLGVALLWTVDLGVLLPVALSARFVSVVGLFVMCRIHVTDGGNWNFDRGEAAQLLRFGGWVTVTAFVGPLMTMFDRFAIGALLGAKAVAHYTIPYQLAERSTVVSGALTNALFPRFAAASDEEEAELAKLAYRTLTAVLTPVFVAAIWMMQPFLALWIDKDFASESALAGQILLVGFWINSLARIPHSQLQSKARPDVVAKCHLGELLPYALLLYLGLTYFGIAGAAGAFALRVAVDLVLLAWFANSPRSVFSDVTVPFGFLICALVLSGPAANLAMDGWFLLLLGVLLGSLVSSWARAPESLKRVCLRVVPGAMINRRQKHG